MKKQDITSAHLIDLKVVLQIMVNQQRISFEEMKGILAKAGLHFIEEGKWKDETGAIYTNSSLAV